MLTALRSTLVKVGYRVLDVASGDEARKVFEAERGIDMLLTDIVMPGELQGTTLAKSLRGMRPDLPVRIMSGYASEATVHGNGLLPQDIRLMKPIRREDLLRAVDKALSQIGGQDPRHERQEPRRNVFRAGSYPVRLGAHARSSPPSRNTPAGAFRTRALAGRKPAYPIAATCAWQGQLSIWSFTIPVACMKA